MRKFKSHFVIGMAALILAACGEVAHPPPATTQAPSAPIVSPVKKMVLSSLTHGGNTEVTWSCQMQVPQYYGEPQDRRQEACNGWWPEVEGLLVWDPVQEHVEALEWSIDVASCQADEEQGQGRWARYGRHRQWFDVAHFPRATFKVSQVVLRSNNNQAGSLRWFGDYTHLIQGVLTINGIAKKVSWPARIAFGKEGVSVDVCRDISRAEFKMGNSQWLGDEMADSIQFSFKVDPAPAVAQLAAKVLAQRGEIHTLQKELTWSKIRAGEDRREWADRLANVESSVEFLRQAAAPQLCAQVLPAQFVDALVMPPVEMDYENPHEHYGNGLVPKRHFSYKGMNAPFKMILVPSDPAKGIAPFYMGETEVTWDLFQPWSHWFDAPMMQAIEEHNKNLRPSNADGYCDTSHNDKRYAGYPALGMTRLTAEKFCVFLSKKTGRKYRLPTEAEWDRAYALGGGDPPTKEGKLAAAWCKENAELTPESYTEAPSKVATRKPNTLGLYDMLGNVAEWVKTPGIADVEGKNTFVRGGDFMTPVAQLSGGCREESDNRRNVKGSWNEWYPNDPPSKWWYMNHWQIGFRLVCEPVNLPAQKQ